MAARSRTPWPLLFGLLVSCAGSGDDGSLDLSGREFVSESLAGRELVAGTEIRLRFHASDLSAHAGCNSMGGEYRFDDHVLVVGGVSTTDIGCDTARYDQDDWLARFLRARPTAELVEPRLTLSSSTETLTLIDREVASPDRPLVDTRWVGNGIGDGTSVSIGPGASLATITFGSDGHVEAFSSCQLGSGAFAADETTIAFADLAYDGVTCADPSFQQLSDTFLFVLDGSQVTYRIEERALTIDRAASSLYFLAAE